MDKATMNKLCWCLFIIIFMIYTHVQIHSYRY